MALNSLSVSNYNIKEIEENKSISLPSISLSGQNKTISVFKINSLYNKYNFYNDIIKRKSKSFVSPFHIYKLYENFFTDNFQTKNILENNNNENKNKNRKSRNLIIKLNKNKETNIILNTNSVGIKKKINFEDFNNNFKKNENNISISNNSNLDEQGEDNKNIVYKRINNKKIRKKSLNKEKQNINNNEIKKDIDKPEIIINESLIKINNERKINQARNNINLCHTSINFHNNLMLSKMKNIPYIRKKATNFKKNIKKIQSISPKAFSIKSEKSIQNIKQSKKALKISSNNNNNNKKSYEGIFNIIQFNRILKKGNIFHIIRFFDYYDIINILKTQNKSLILLLNKSLAQIYFFKTKKELSQYHNFFDIVKCTIVHYKIKDTLKIDLMVNIRIKEYKNYLEPLYFKIAYAHNFYKKIINSKELITKEESELQNKDQSEKLCDYYSYDFYPKFIHKSNPEKNKIIFLSKELPIIGKDSNNIAKVQPILPLSEGDQGLLNLEIYNTEKGFINPDKIKIYLKINDLRKHLNQLEKKGINDIRISEYENICLYWKNINLYEHRDTIKTWVNGCFGKLFDVKKILYENVGIIIFKVFLKAVKVGEINNKKNIGINIKIKGRNDMIKNEIRKNNLIFERREVVEIKVGDIILYYFCIKQ